MSHKRSRTSQVMQVFSLNPMPYPVLLILAVIFIFIGIQWVVSYESMVESTEENFGWLLMATPVVLVFAVKWLSSTENPESFFGRNRRRRMNYASSSEGCFPWGVAAMIVLVLVLLQYQSSFHESWFV
ncbi:putative Transmembrane protein [Heracleum sosnowskyi]|uniref:Transmembrane protein n=1 Tax=Heracleum sosnowskyi TaxID=360622 RepID=A0AAD8MBL6_9APIA|nr:putative Transmembrane protein [Heracleum sosnowskyi]